jgi:hypothetical protein
MKSLAAIKTIPVVDQFFGERWAMYLGAAAQANQERLVHEPTRDR